MTYLYKLIHTADGQRVEVTYNRPCNIMLLSPLNFTRYQNGETFKYHGGYFDGKSPAVLWPPRPGHWYVVADLGGESGTLKASVFIH
jgi:hypothetical protein